jgi:hypothetical protein
MLERLDCDPGGVAEIPISIYRGAAVEYGDEATLDIGDCCPLVPEGERETYRYAAISWSN